MQLKPSEEQKCKYRFINKETFILQLFQPFFYILVWLLKCLYFYFIQNLIYAGETISPTNFNIQPKKKQIAMIKILLF